VINPGFLSELKRRKTVRVALVYLAAAYRCCRTGEVKAEDVTTGR
jgi:hypothetical protein